MLQTRRHIDGRDFFWLVNNHEKPQNCEVVISGVHGAAECWDCETGEVKAHQFRGKQRWQQAHAFFPAVGGILAGI